MNVLVLTSVLPAPVDSKKRENDVLLKTAHFHEKVYPTVRYHFVLIIPYSNWFLSLISRKWKDFRTLRKRRSYYEDGRKINIIAVPSFRNDTFLRKTFVKLSFITYRRRLKKIITLHNIDLIHAHNVRSDAGFANTLYKNYGIPYIITTRDIHRSKVNKYMSNNLRDARSLVSLNYSLKSIADKFNDSSYLVPHGIEDDFVDNVVVSKEPSNKLRVVTICRLLDWKNIDKVLYALNEVDFDFSYDIYGDGPDLERLVSILNKLKIRNHVDFKGHIPHDKVASTLAKYDVFVLISFPETFGRVFLEALASSLPIVASKNCGMDGFVKNGLNGILVDYSSKKELKETLYDLNVNEEKRIEISKNAKKLSDSFLWSSIVRKLDCLYRSAIL